MIKATTWYVVRVKYLQKEDTVVASERRWRRDIMKCDSDKDAVRSHSRSELNASCIVRTINDSLTLSQINASSLRASSSQSTLGPPD